MDQHSLLLSDTVSSSGLFYFSNFFGFILMFNDSSQ
ncbi:transposase [Proteus sp. CD3]|nr:transposase [Proteus sp. CD3]